jgi:hypothetical protein
LPLNPPPRIARKFIASQLTPVNPNSENVN